MKDFTPTNGRVLAVAAVAIALVGFATIIPWQIVSRKALQAELAELRSEEAALRVQLEQIRLENKRLPQPNFERGSAATNVRELQAAAQAELNELLARYKEKHPAVVAQRAKLATLNSAEAQSVADPTPPGADVKLSEKAKARQIELLNEEIALVEQQVENQEMLSQAGRTSFESLLAAQRELLSLRMELAALKSDRAGMKELLEQQVKVAETHLQRASALAKDRLPRSELDRAKLELLKLQRQLAAFE